MSPLVSARIILVAILGVATVAGDVPEVASLR